MFTLLEGNLWTVQVPTGTGAGDHGPGGGRRETVRCGLDFCVASWKAGRPAQVIVSPELSRAKV